MRLLLIQDWSNTSYFDTVSRCVYKLHAVRSRISGGAVRSFDPSRELDLSHVNRMGVEGWMLEQLELNPSYVFWGPGEDYMKGAKDSGWDSSCEHEEWKNGDIIRLDDLTEVVNFYFSVERDSVSCDRCHGSGYSDFAKELADSFRTDIEKVLWPLPLDMNSGLRTPAHRVVSKLSLFPEFSLKCDEISHATNSITRDLVIDMCKKIKLELAPVTTVGTAEGP